ncbi:MAG: hypothetical protein [Circular genetic element sp.]|nr:MAG: hypothetical protein [Circular genetic element sp.]
MAYKKSRGMQRSSKIEPSAQSLYFQTPNFNGSRTATLDLSLCASLANRRFYRQGINWAVSSVELFSTQTTTGQVISAKLPNTWVMSNAWEKAFRTWQRMNREALEETPSVRPKFLDFKVFMDSIHHGSDSTITNYNLLPVAVNGVTVSTATPGEWEYSKVYIPTAINASAAQTNDFELVATGSNFPGAGTSGFNAVSLIEGYAASRGLPNVLDPNTPDDAQDASGSTPHNWMSAMFNDGLVQTSEVIEDMITENNIAPYPFENGEVQGALPGTVFTDTMYPGGANQMSGLEVVDAAYITPTTIGGVTRLKGSNFPCGLLRLVFNNISMEPGVDFFGIKVNLVPGPHRGYLCEPMTEM